MRKKNTRKTKLWYLSMFLIVILFLYTFNVTTSRYIGQVSAQKDVVAIPILTLSNNKESYSINNMKPGDEKIYEFEVSNTENGQINEVLLDYYFIVNIGNEIPLTVELYDITQGETKLNITDGKTPKVRMDYGTEILKKYRLKIIWDKKDNSLSYINKKVNCNITLEAEQVV